MNMGVNKMENKNTGHVLGEDVYEQLSKSPSSIIDAMEQREQEKIKGILARNAGLDLELNSIIRDIMSDSDLINGLKSRKGVTHSSGKIALYNYPIESLITLIEMRDESYLPQCRFSKYKNKGITFDPIRGFVFFVGSKYGTSFAIDIHNPTKPSEDPWIYKPHLNEKYPEPKEVGIVGNYIIALTEIPETWKDERISVGNAIFDGYLKARFGVIDTVQCNLKNGIEGLINQQETEFMKAVRKNLYG